MYLISVYFDEETNKILNRYISQIAAMTGNLFMTDNHVPPHMTITAMEARNRDELIAAFEHVKAQFKAGKIQFVSIGQLLPYVAYATPVLNEYLMELQNIVFESIKDISDSKVSKYYKPYSYLPHVTLAKKLNRQQLLTAIEYLVDRFQPFEASIVEIGLAKTNPHEDIVRYRV